MGLVAPLREALEASREAIDLALVYGSVAKGRATAASDVDLLLVSDTLTLESAYGMLADVESALGRPINPTLYTNAEFEQRLRDGNLFLRKVLSGDTILLQGRLPDDFRPSGESGPHRQLKPEPGSVCCCRDRLLAGFPWPQKETKLI